MLSNFINVISVALRFFFRVNVLRSLWMRRPVFFFFFAGLPSFSYVLFICRAGQVLVFVEVRARASHEYGTSVETINPAKQERLRLAAERYLQELGRTDIFIRFDAVGILLTSGQVPVCTLYPDLFQLHW